MLITVNVQLAEGQTLAYTPDAAALQVLTALGGNSTVDTCLLTVAFPMQPGQAGAEQPPQTE